MKNFDQLNNQDLHNLLKTGTKTVTVYPSIIVPFQSTRDCNRIKIGISRKFIDWQKPFNSPWLRRILLKWRLLLKDFVNDGFSEWRFEIWEEDVKASIRQRRLIWGRYPQKICVEDFRENCESAWDRLHTARLLTPGFMFPRPLDTDIYIYKMEEMYVSGERESWHCLALHTSNRGAVFRKSWPAAHRD